MPDHTEPKVLELEQPSDRVTQWVDAKKEVLHFMVGAQRVVLEEMVFTAYAMFDRVRTETHLWNEFSAKLAGAHSVHDWNAMTRECSQHQLEFLRRDCDRMFRHGERLVEATSNLLDNRE